MASNLFGIGIMAFNCVILVVIIVALINAVKEYLKFKHFEIEHNLYTVFIIKTLYLLYVNSTAFYTSFKTYILREVELPNDYDLARYVDRSSVLGYIVLMLVFWQTVKRAVNFYKFN